MEAKVALKMMAEVEEALRVILKTRPRVEALIENEETDWEESLVWWLYQNALEDLKRAIERNGA